MSDHEDPSGSPVDAAAAAAAGTSAAAAAGESEVPRSPLATTSHERVRASSAASGGPMPPLGLGPPAVAEGESKDGGAGGDAAAPVAADAASGGAEAPTRSASFILVDPPPATSPSPPAEPFEPASPLMVGRSGPRAAGQDASASWTARSAGGVGLQEVGVATDFSRHRPHGGDDGDDDRKSSDIMVAMKTPGVFAGVGRSRRPAGGEKCCGRFEYGTQPWHLMPYVPAQYKQDLGQIKDEVIAGVTVAFAQVSESIAFAFIAGVGPLLGLHAAWIIGLSLSLFGSRPGMINGATGVRAAVLAPYVQKFGIGYLFYIVFCISFFQFAAGVFKLAKFVRMVPRPVMIGFVNGLAIVLTLGQIFQFQIPCDPPVTSMTRPVPTECTSASPPEHVMIEGTELALMFVHIVLVFLTIKLIPKIPKAGKYIPASLTGLLLSTFVEWVIFRAMDLRTPVIGEVGTVSGGLPIPFFDDPQYSGKLAPFNWETIKVCIEPAFIAAAAGAVEAVMTMEVVNDKTDTTNEAPNQQLIALAIGNAVSAIYGTMGGGATIGLSVINVESGANGLYRISGVVAGIMVLIFVLVAAPLIEIVPTASLVGVMVIVILSTFDWESLFIIITSAMPRSVRRHSAWLGCTRRYPWTSPHRKIRRVDAVVIVLVTVVTLVQDLFVAVMAGVLLTAASFAWNMGERIAVETKDEVVKTVDEAGNEVAIEKKVYRLSGPLFFASAQRFATLFDPKNDPDVVEVHFDRDGSELSDYSGIHALNVVGEKYRALGKKLYVFHLDARSKSMLTKGDRLRRHFELGRQPSNLDMQEAVAAAELGEDVVVEEVGAPRDIVRKQF